MSVLRGLSVDVMRGIVAEAWPTVLRPLVYHEALDLAASHEARGECVYIVSAALQEVVDMISQELGFDGALASQAEVEEGVYTGRLERRLYGIESGSRSRSWRAPRGSISRSRLPTRTPIRTSPFLEAVGHPVAVNPDRELRRVVRERGWPALRFRHRLAKA